MLAVLSRVVRMSRSAGKKAAASNKGQSCAKIASCEVVIVCETVCEEMSTSSEGACKTALVLIAKGTEELECVTTVDVLRRGGVVVDLAGLCSKKAVECRSQCVICPDIALSDAKGPYDAIVLPGGIEGSKAFCKSPELGHMLREQERCGRIVAAICAGPTAFRAHKVGLNKRVTSFPSVKEDMLKEKSYTYVENQKVVVDGNIITSRGPGTAMNFGLVLLDKLCGKARAEEVASALLVEHCPV